jgi:uncharacterized protein involved in outer membrane biogenesis
MLPERRKLLRILLAVIVVPVFLLLAGVVFLLFGDLGRLRGPIERRVGAAIGRELNIDGSFTLDLLPSPRLVAEDVTLAGSEWSDEPFMARVGLLRLEVDLWSLFRGPVRVEDLEIVKARVRLERNAEGDANWDFGFGDRRRERDAGRPGSAVLWERIRLEDVELSYHDPSRESPVRCAIDRLHAGLDAEGVFAVLLEGALDSAPVQFEGRITPLHRLFEGEPWLHRLDGRVGRIEFTTHGNVDEIASLRGVDIELEASGPDIATVTDFLDLPSLGSGRFRLDGKAESSSRGVSLSLNADLVELQIDARGHVDSLAEPRDLELQWNVSGANLYAAGALVGWNRLPEGPFEASGRLSGDGARTTLDRLRARVGDHRLSVEGVVRTSSSLVDRNLEFRMAGPDLSAFSALAGARLPSRRYRLEGRLVRRGERIEIARLAGKLGRIDLEATGMADEDLRLARAELDFRASGPDLSSIEALIGRTVPPGPMEVQGHLAREPSRLVLRNVEGRVGETAFQLDGEVAFAAGLAGTDLRLRVGGRDPCWLAPLTNLKELPVEPYEVGGRIHLGETGFDLKGVTGSYGGVTFDLDGSLRARSAFEVNDLRIRLSGPDLSWLASLGGVEGLPADPFDLEGRVRSLDAGYRVDDFRASVGEIDLIARGLLGNLPRIDGSDLEVEIRGPDLSALSRYPRIQALPKGRFAASGRVRAGSGAYRLEQVSGELGRHRFGLDGVLVPESGLVGSDVELQLSGPDLEDAARMAREAGLKKLPELPAADFSLSGRVRVVESGYELDDLTGRVSDAEARIDGSLDRSPGGSGMDLSIEARGPDASILPPIAGKRLPGKPFSVRGRMEREEGGARFRGVEIELGEHRALVDGVLGDPPKLAGTDLHVQANGPDLSLLVDLADLSLPVNDPYDFAAHFAGSPERFAMREFHARVGNSDVGGFLELDLRGDRPDLRGKVESERIDLAGLFDAEPAGRSEGETPGRFLPDAPLDLEFLDWMDADVRWAAGEVNHRRETLRNVQLEYRIRDGRLQLDSGRAEGYDGNYRLTLDIAPMQEEYRVVLHGRAEHARLRLLPYSGDPGEVPPLDLELHLAGTGRSIRSLASSANGHILATQSDGRIDNTALDQVGAEMLSELYNALNPFAKREPHTRLECAVFVVDIEDGVARLGPLAVRTDKTVTVGSGTVDLGTEELSLHWATKPRKGVGLSLSAVTNLYVKLGGTLSQPQLSISPLRAARATGAAVFTGGMSLLGRALFNRITAEQDVCRRALKIEKKQSKKREKKAR